MCLWGILLVPEILIYTAASMVTCVVHVVSVVCLLMCLLYT